MPGLGLGSALLAVQVMPQQFQSVPQIFGYVLTLITYTVLAMHANCQGCARAHGMQIVVEPTAVQDMDKQMLE